jgi:hypothetical protein
VAFLFSRYYGRHRRMGRRRISREILRNCILKHVKIRLNLLSSHDIGVGHGARAVISRTTVGLRWTQEAEPCSREEEIDSKASFKPRQCNTRQSLSREDEGTVIQDPSEIAEIGLSHLIYTAPIIFVLGCSSTTHQVSTSISSRAEPPLSPP